VEKHKLGRFKVTGDIRNRRSRERGAAVVEFALVLPLLLLVLFGIIEFSILLYDKAVITNASREAAREWVVYRDGTLTPKLTQSELQKIVDDYSKDRLISFNSGASPTASTNPADPTSSNSGDQLSLTVEYSYDFLFLPAFMEGLLPTVALDATTVMRAE
jgi:Flp pilus assembly protein TadG